MRRPGRLLLLLSGLSLGCADGEPPVPPAVDHVVLITVDTLRADALGFAGNQRVTTPTLDRLAAGGWAFRRAHAHNVVTLPSHANILTGLHPYQHGIRDNSGFVLPDDLPTAATLFADAGFATAAFVAAFPLDARFGLARGFELYDDRLPEGSRPTEFILPERPGDEVVARAREWWRGESSRRRFAWLHLFEPHAPYRPAEPFAERYAEAPYLGEVAAVDAFLTPFLAPILGGEEGATLVVFTSDHGEALGDHGELTHGLFAYEATLKVPLVLWAPGLVPRVEGSPARHVDLLPTMLEAAGLAVPTDLPGRSLWHPAADDPESTYFEALSASLNRGWAPLRGVIAGDDKLIALPIPELYDLADDPAEERNLFAGHRRRAQALRSQLPEEALGAPRRGAVPEAVAASLRSLGYVTSDTPTERRATPQDDPKTLIDLDRKIHRVIDLYQRRQLEEATRLAREIVDERPEMPLGHAHLAQVLLEDGRLAAAISAMEAALERGVASDALIRQLALSLAEAGRAEAGIPLLHPLAEAGDLAAQNALGRVLCEAGRLDEAEAALRQVLTTDPENPTAHQHLALVQLHRGRWSQAVAAARDALRQNDRLALAWSYVGVGLYNLGQPREALAAWRQAIVLDERSFDALYNLTLVAAEIGETETAREALRRFIATAPPERYGPDLAKARQRLRALTTRSP